MRFLLSALMLLLCAHALAAIDVMPFKDEEQEQRFRLLTEQLRCPKCQNNSIADSSSAIAADLRQKVFALMQEGKSNDDIVDYMVARYGNFVTYDPPLTPLTILLWVLPATAIAIGGWAIVARSRRRVRIGLEAFSAGRAPESKPAGPWVYIPGAVIALAVGAASYCHTGHYQQVRIWLQAVDQTPALLARVQEPKALPLDEDDLRRLALGLRTRLWQNPDANVEEWLMLGRIGRILDNAGMVTQAYARAYALAPENDRAAFSYAEALLRVSDPRGDALVRQLMAHQRVNARLLNLYALSALEQAHFSEALTAWKTLLNLLPPDDARRAVIERHINQTEQRLTHGDPAAEAPG
ncbi:Cytochrome c-type biogenesis protein CcmH [Klebsiella pasteurii]|uniref:cytochrome c-type biogenesis protein CcmH n=1 Tax=Klebsiella pasteurii TaxID=2587529 RepID=UPI00115A2F5D|nr:cytochrome c-type biogenesis protein CcmH [Klebsiella pasteurii]VUS68916.1 Cytochrome c-type biogenesis protein CcmH [Klebsiella pasteurii]VUT16659.1 Cytochrome c-type biogenesis protein CcmH [Klebsiella pasteurii]